MSVEGINGSGWRVVERAGGGWIIRDGETEIAVIHDQKVTTLFLGAPQLWAAANTFLLAMYNGAAYDGEVYRDTKHALGEQVARCVGKGNWKEVAQS